MEANWLVETTFFHFLKQQSTAASESCFSLTTGPYFSASPLFRHVETSFSSAGDSMCLFQFFSASGNLLKFLGKSIFKGQPYSY